MAVSISETSSAFSRSSVASTLPHIRPVIRDNVSDATPLLSYLMGNLRGEMRKAPGGGRAGDTGDGIPGIIVGGRDIQVPVQLIENTTVGSYSGADELDITHQDTDEYALFPIRQASGSITLIGRDWRGNKGEAQIYSLLASKTSRLTEDLRMELNRQMIGDGTGNGGRDMLGLAAIVSTSTLANISPTTNPKWQPGGFASGNSRHAINSAGLTFSSGGLDDMRQQVARLMFGEDGVDAIFMSRTVWSAYSDAIEGNVRYTQVETGDASFKRLAFQGIPCFFDHALPTASAQGVMYFLNSRHIQLVRDSEGDFAWLDDEFVRPVNQDMYVKTMIVEGNLVTDNRRMHGVTSSITGT